MRFKLSLKPVQDRQKLLFNYQYPLQAWIYGLLHQADERYAAFLHERGYTVPDSNKAFKHFTFSNLVIPKTEKIHSGDSYMILRSEEIYLTVSFYIDKAAEHFIVGLFQNQRLSLYNRDYQADFVVERVETLAVVIPDEPRPTVRLRTLSPMVIAEKVNNLDQYLPPDDERFATLLALNIIDKYQSTRGEGGLSLDAAAARQMIRFRLLPNQRIRQRKMLIKEGKEEQQTKIVGYYGFDFELAAPRELLEVAIHSGIGKYSSMSCGCCELLTS